MSATECEDVTKTKLSLTSRCFLCLQEVEGCTKYISPSLIHHQNTILLFQILEIPHLEKREHKHKFGKIIYCQTCLKNVSNVWKMLQDLEELKREITRQKSVFMSHFNINAKSFQKSGSPEKQLRLEILSELEFKSIMANLSKARTTRAGSSKQVEAKVMKNVLIPKVRVHTSTDFEEELSDTDSDVNIESATNVNVSIKSEDLIPEINSAINTEEIGCTIPKLNIGEQISGYYETLPTFNDADDVEVKSESMDFYYHIDLDPFLEVGQAVESGFGQSQLTQISTEFQRSTVTAEVNTHNFDININESEYTKHDGSTSILQKRFICGTCGIIFEDSVSLQNHNLTHLELVNVLVPPLEGILEIFKCQYCEKTFNSKYYAKLHERIHNGDAPFRCQYCEKVFTQKGHLARHERLLHTFLKCQYCNKTFAFEDQRKLHERSHLGKRLKCGYCDCTFNRSDGLKRHEFVHTGEMPYKCQYCERGFSRTDHLKLHEMTHTGLRPFQCSHCFRTFGQNSHLKSHTITHQAKL